MFVALRYMFWTKLLGRINGSFVALLIVFVTFAVFFVAITHGYKRSKSGVINDRRKVQNRRCPRTPTVTIFFIFLYVINLLRFSYKIDI